MKLSDEAIGHIAKQLQIAILTGTDIVDNLRMIQLQEENGQLFLDSDYLKHAQENEQRMIEEAQKLAEQLDK